MMAAQGIDIVSRIRDEGLKAPKINTDDTPMPVLDPGARSHRHRQTMDLSRR